uniref:Uncharacterized protein n=1 Tax=Ditylenchus dipsaci TaxID=166011 RepID=A0A915DC78_9BILA
MKFYYYFALIFVFLQLADQAAISKREVSMGSLPTDFGHEVVCREGLWMCPNSTKCIVAVWRCDGRPDCANGEDELDCSGNDREDSFMHEILKNDKPNKQKYEYVWETRRKIAANGLAKMDPMELEMLSQMTQEYYNELYDEQCGKIFLAFITPFLFLCCILGTCIGAHKEQATSIK